MLINQPLYLPDQSMLEAENCLNLLRQQHGHFFLHHKDSEETQQLHIRLTSLQHQGTTERKPKVNIN